MRLLEKLSFYIPELGLSWRKALGFITILTLFLASAVFGAEYDGKKVDGIRYSGFARSLSTGKYYPVHVMFEQNHANVRLASGKSLDLMLDEETIEDPEEVVATDPRGLWWALSIDSLDAPLYGPPTLTVAGRRPASRASDFR